MVLSLCLSFLGCGTSDIERRYTTKATIFLVNETSEIVKSDSRFNYLIQPGETLVHSETYSNEYSIKPTKDSYQPFPHSYLFFYGDGTKCEIGLRDIENYENRKEVEPLVFELTFRFTEERKANAENCN